jgi:protease IV
MTTRRTGARGRHSVAVVLSALAMGVAWRAHADPLPPRAERILSPGRSAVSEDSAEALVLNPANLGYMPGAEARWTWVRCPDDAQKVGCGHAFELATPLLWGLATGLRVDFVQPPWGVPGEGVEFPFRGYDYTWITWGVGLKLSDSLGFGWSLQRSYSTNAYVDSLFGITAGLSYRMNSHFAFAAVAHDFNGPSTQVLPTDGLPVLDQSYVLGAAFRPTGRRAFEVALDMKYLQGSQEWLPRLSAQLDIPYVGRARGDVEVAHFPNDDRRGVVATAGLELAFDGVRAGGGAIFGNGLGSSSTAGEYFTAALVGYSAPGIPRPSRAVYIRLESTPSNREHVALLRAMWKLSEERDVAALTLVLRAEPADSYAHAEEVADAIRLLRARGKKVLCSLEDNAGKSLYVCANADRTVVNPAGGLRYAGLKFEYLYLAGLLDKLGIRADFVRIGAHKTAPEEFMNRHASDTARADHEDLLRQDEAVFVKDVAQGRHISEEQVRAATVRGPFIASEAKEAHFVDGTAFDDELERATRELVGHSVSYEKYEEETEVPDTFGPRGKIALIYVDGDMIDGHSAHIPLIDTRLAGSYTMAEVIKQVREDPSYKAAVLRIESPGGSSMAADVMWRELVLLGQKKPLIVSMGSVAASGGYYIATPGHVVMALPLTVTGSIGIFYGKVDIAGLLDKIGVNVETYRTAPRADAESIFRPFTDEERKELEHKVGQFYDVFLDRVAQGRRLSKEEVDASGQGRVWTGQQAVARRLVDRIGGLRDALDEARLEAGLPYDAPVVELPRESNTLLDTALKLAGLHAEEGAAAALPDQVKRLARALAPMAVYSGDIPLARMEWMPVGGD